MVGRGRVHLLIGSSCCAKFALVKVMLQDFKGAGSATGGRPCCLLEVW